MSIGIAGALRFDDAVAWRRVAAGDISNEKGRILQSAHAEVGGLLLIPDADEEISGSGALKGGGIDEDETIVFINHFDDSDEAWDLGLRRLWRRKESFGSQEKAATRNGRLGCGFGGSLARAFGTSSPRGGRADLVAQPQTANAIRTAPKPKPFSFGGILVKLQQTWARCLF